MTVLLFDIDNTLLDFDKAEYDALGKFLPTIKLKIIRKIVRLTLVKTKRFGVYTNQKNFHVKNFYLLDLTMLLEL